MFSQTLETDRLKNLLVDAKDDTVRFSVLNQLVEINIWSNPEQALQFARQELLLARKAKLNGAEIFALSTNGNVLAVLGDYSHAIYFFLQSIKLAEKSTYDRSLNYQNLSEVYSDAGDYNNAILYAYKAKA